MADFYYHITKPENLESILETGLKANSEGQIFLFDNVSISLNGTTNSVADCIAKNQIFLDEYAMLEISSEGILTELLPDNVGELSEKFQYIAMQNFIDERFINVFGIHKTQYKPFFQIPTTFDNP